MAPSSTGALGARSYLFFLSYARQDASRFLERLYEDLVATIAERAGVPADEVAFRDTRSIETGKDWPDELDEAISVCRAFVPLYSPRYFTRDTCGREWAAFRSRLERQATGGRLAPLIVPIVWIPLGSRFDQLPEAVKRVQYHEAEMGEIYGREGVQYLIRCREEAVYERFLVRFAKRLVDAVERHAVAPAEPRLRLGETRSAFEQVRAAQAHLSHPEQVGATLVGATRPFERHQAPIRALAFSPDGAILASGSSDRTVRLWSPLDGREMRRLEGYRAVTRALAFSPDGAILATGSADRTVRLWSPEDCREMRRLEGHLDWVRTVAFSPDGAILASGSDDRTVRLWSSPDGQEMRRLEGHQSRIRAVTFSPDGAILASASSDRTVRLWSPLDGREIRRLEGQAPLLTVAFSPDGATLASGSADRIVRLWRAQDGSELRRLAGHRTPVRSVAFSPDGTTLASGSADHTVRLWSPQHGTELRRLEGHEAPIEAVAFSPDGRHLASGSADNTIRIWEVSTGRCLAILAPLPED